VLLVGYLDLIITFVISNLNC